MHSFEEPVYIPVLSVIPSRLLPRNRAVTHNDCKVSWLRDMRLYNLTRNPGLLQLTVWRYAMQTFRHDEDICICTNELIVCPTRRSPIIMWNNIESPTASCSVPCAYRLHHWTRPALRIIGLPAASLSSLLWWWHLQHTR